MAAVQHVRAQADAERKTALTVAAERYGAEPVGVPPKRSPQHKAAATAERRQEPAVQIAAAAAVEHGERVQGKPVRLPLSQQQAKAAATAAQEQERFRATVIQAVGQRVVGVPARGKVFARLEAHNLAGQAAHKRVRLPAHGAAARDRIVLRQASLQ